MRPAPAGTSNVVEELGRVMVPVTAATMPGPVTEATMLVAARGIIRVFAVGCCGQAMLMLTLPICAASVVDVVVVVVGDVVDVEVVVGLAVGAKVDEVVPLQPANAITMPTTVSTSSVNRMGVYLLEKRDVWRE